VFDASALIALARLGLLPVVFGTLGPLRVAAAVITESVGNDRPGSREIKTSVAAGEILVSEAPVDSELVLGAGESATIALAKRIDGVAVLDDRDARRVAGRLGVPVTGTIAILVRLRRIGLISSIRQQLDELDRIGFRASPGVRAWALEVTGEDS
jgi:predicted nucleic acid-binding protein